MPFLNTKRLRDYPRLMLLSTWLIFGINVLLHQGWIGAFGQVIGGDFIMFYSTGLIYRSQPQLIFDYNTQLSTQQSLVTPSVLPGYNPYMNPPYVAPFYALWTFISLHWAIIIWTILAIISAFLCAYYLLKLIPNNQKPSWLTYAQLVIIILSFFPFLEGLLSGQNHWITLLLVTGIIYSITREKWSLAGVLAGLLIYKPQFVLGFIIIWLVWKNFKSILSFSLVTLGWISLYLIINGFGLFRIYFQQSRVFMNLPYIEGFPNYLLVTFYGFLTSIFPIQLQPIVSIISTSLLIFASIGLVWLAYTLRKLSMVERTPAIVAALILPLLATPYALLHDFVILIPAFILWINYRNTQKFINLSFIIYFGAFLFTFIGALTKIAWLSLLNIGLCSAILIWVIKNHRSILRTKSIG